MGSRKGLIVINIAGKEFDESELATLAKAGMLQIGQKNDPASTTPPEDMVGCERMLPEN